jgi:hypothetical protein
MKPALGGQAFDWPEELLHTTTTFLEEIQVSELKGVFQYWVEQVPWVLSYNGGYYRK